MKRLLLKQLLLLLAGIFLFNILISQTIQLLPEYHNITNMEFDKFLYAEEAAEAERYEFRIRQPEHGIDTIIIKNVNYLNLNELGVNNLFLNTGYRISTRYVSSGFTSNWGNMVNVTTTEESTYSYGKVRIQFRQSEFSRYSGFYMSDSLVFNNNIEGFDELSESAGIISVSYPIKKILELTGKDPYSCIDLTFDKKFSVDSIMNFFNTVDYIEFIEPHYKYTLSSIPLEYDSSNPDFWHLNDINAEGAWNMLPGQSAPEIIIAVIDNVFDIDHEDLRRNIYVNIGEIPTGLLSDFNGNGVIDADDLLTYYRPRGYNSLRELFTNPPQDEIFNGIDDDGNGYADDICGWNLANNNNKIVPAHYNGSHVSHGTHVAGIAGSVSNNGGMCALSNNRARILPIKLGNDEEQYGPTVIDILTSIEYILSLKEKPHIVSMSLGGPAIDNLDNALQILEDQFNVLSVAATGNNHSRNLFRYPANYTNVLAVGSTNINNIRSGFSNYGDLIGPYVLAPGENIKSSVAGIGDLYDYFNGTSMSTPLASSLASLLYSYNPNITPEYVKDAIICGCDNNRNQIINYNSADDGSGKINAYESIVCLKNMQPSAYIIENNRYYCPGGHNYVFTGTSLTSLDNIAYNWSVSGGSYNITGGTNNEDLIISFNNSGTYTIILRVNNNNPLHNISTYSINIEVDYPSVSILNGDNSQVCTGDNTSMYLQLEGAPPFTINYSFNGITTQINNILDSHYTLRLPINGLSTGSTSLFRINSFQDAVCEGNTAESLIEFIECSFACGGKYNNIWHFSKLNYRPKGIFFNPDATLVDQVLPIGYLADIARSTEGTASIADRDGTPILIANEGNVISIKPGCNNRVLTAARINEALASSTQGHLILPNLSNDNKYFVITVTELRASSRCLSWGIVDFTNSECGEFEFKGNFYNEDAEKLAACQIAGDDGYWIVTHRRDQHAFNVYKLLFSNETVVFENTQILPQDFFHSLGDLGELKFDLSMNYLTAGLSGKVLGLYEFNRNINSNPELRIRVIGERRFNYDNNPNPNVNPHAIYSVEFSPDSKFIYFGFMKKLYRIPVEDFMNQDPELIHSFVGEGLEVYLRLGPDMKIYVGNSFRTSVIQNPENPLQSIDFLPGYFNTNQDINFPPRIPVLDASFKLMTVYENCTLSLRLTDIYGSIPVSFSWNTGVQEDYINIFETGEYSVDVTFANGCVVSESLVIDNVDLAVPQITLTDEYHPCVDQGEVVGFIHVNVEGGTAPYVYQWFDSSGNIVRTDRNLRGVVPGLYSLTVTDSEGCTASFERSIYPVNSPLIEVHILEHICDNNRYGSAEVTTEGWDELSYLWDNGEITHIAENLSEGMHYVTVTNANGCYTVDSVEISTMEFITKFEASNECLYAGDAELYFFTHRVSEEEYLDNNYEYLWECSNGTTSTNYRFYPHFKEEGYYCVRLTISDSYCTATESAYIYVYPNKCHCGIEYDEKDIFVNGIQQWLDRSLTIEGTLAVGEGSLLKIKNCDIRFGPRGKIIIYPGGSLVCDRSVLSSLEKDDCHSMWYGIEVHGSPYAGNISSLQGSLIVVNGSEISNAHIGVLVGERDQDFICRSIGLNAGSPFVEPSGGGMLNIYTSGNTRNSFANNGIHIKVLRKGNYANDASIHNTDFMCKGKLLDKRYNQALQGCFRLNSGANPWAGLANSYQRTDKGIVLENLLMADIYNCTFNNMETPVFSIDAKHKIGSCKFVNARHGIFINYSVSGHSQSNQIAGCLFDSIPNFPPPQTPSRAAAMYNSHIYIAGGVGDYIRDNTFGERFRTLNISNLGIYLNNSSGFNVSENYFNNIPTAVSVNNSGIGGGYIGAGYSSSYINWNGNIYYNCLKNMAALGLNPKLKLVCNMCDNNVYTFIANINSSGLLYDQGMPFSHRRQDPPLFRDPESRGAGNEFDGTAPSPKIIKSSTLVNYNYYHHSNSETTPTLSPISGERKVNLHNINVTKTSNESTCNYYLTAVSDIPAGGVIRFTQKYADIDGFTSTLDKTGRIIEDLQIRMKKISLEYDRGNTSMLLKEVVNSKDPYKLKLILEDHYPLSDTILIELLVNYPLTDDGFYDVMLQNSPVSSNVEEYLYKRLELIPEKYASAIKGLQSDNPYAKEKTYTLLKKERDFWDVTRRIYLHDILFLLADSKNNNNKDAIYILQSEKSFYGKKLLFSAYFAEDMYPEAYKELDNIMAKASTSEEKDWLDYHYFLTGLHKRGKNFYNLDAGELDYLRTTANRCPADGIAANAQSILIFYYNEFPKECEEEKYKKDAKEITLEFKQEDIGTAYMGDNYPDPFSTETYIDYYIPSGSIGKIIINDIFGRKIGEYDIKEGVNTLEINSSGWQQGVYTYSLFINGNIIDTKKMVLTK